MILTYIASGIVVGCLLGITGVGGGALMTPLLIMVFKIPAAIAVGTDLLFSGITKALGVALHHKKNGNVNWHIAFRLSIGSLPAAGLSLVFLNMYAHSGHDLTSIIKPAIGVALLLTTFALLNKKRNLSPNTSKLSQTRRSQLTVLLGAVVGVFVTISSVGAGALGTAVIIVLYPALSALEIVGTGLAFSIPLAFVAGCGHLGLGNVSLELLGSLLIGSLPGIWLGSIIGSKIPDAVLRPALATILFVVAIRCF
jgi:uncharacterized membrane protein YfcA